MVTALVVAAIAVALGLCGVLGATALRLLRAQGPAENPAPSSHLVEMEARLAKVEVAIQELPPLWEKQKAIVEAHREEAAKQHRLAGQAREAAERARRELVDGEDEPVPGPDLFTEHAEESPEQGVFPLRESVESSSAYDELTRRAIAAGWRPTL